MPRKKQNDSVAHPVFEDNSIAPAKDKRSNTAHQPSDTAQKAANLARGSKRKNDASSLSESSAERAPKRAQQTVATNDRPKRSGVRRLLPNGFEEADTEASNAVAVSPSAGKRKTPAKAPARSLVIPRIQIVNGRKNHGKSNDKQSPNKKTVEGVSKPFNPSASLSAKLQQKFTKAVSPASDEDSDESDSWEAVEEAKLASDGDNEAGPSTSTPVEITINVGAGPKKKKEVDMQKYLLAQLKKRQKEVALDTHKVSVLCGLAHGFHLNHTIGQDPHLLSLALSCWDKKTLSKVSAPELDVGDLRILVAAVRHLFPVRENDPDAPVDVVKSLESKRCTSYRNLTMVMVLMLRSLNLDVRLIYSMQPLPVTEVKIPKSVLSGKKRRSNPSPYFGTKKNTPKKFKVKARRTRKSSSLDDGSGSSGEDDNDSPGPSKRGRRNGSRNVTLETDDLSESEDSEESSPVRSKEPAANVRKTTFVKGSGLHGRSAKKSEKAPFVEQTLVPGEVGIDYWLDVYCSRAKSYVPVQCWNGQVNSYNISETKASQPLQYVVAFGTPRSIKDVTPKFSHAWLTVNRKLQIDPAWWQETLRLFPPLNHLRNAEEDDFVRDVLLQRPIPSSVQEFKGHPLYVLQRHLLKYEALYPPNPVPVGQCRGENFYLRELVHLLHTKENWLKEGRVIKADEVPYKEVKRMKRAAPTRHLRNSLNKNLMEALASKQPEKDQMSGLYGLWQTEDYTPPVAENGTVPRNEYGNVDLFKPSMLPVGCVHIPIKSIHKVAKKLGIDCAAAMTGWDFSGGWCHPVHDGWVVCAEYEETLLDGWNSQQFEIEREEEEKKAQRALDNWRKLVKSAMLRTKLNRKWGVAEPELKKKKVPEVIDVDSD